MGQAAPGSQAQIMVKPRPAAPILGAAHESVYPKVLLTKLTRGGKAGDGAIGARISSRIMYVIVESSEWQWWMTVA